MASGFCFLLAPKPRELQIPRRVGWYPEGLVDRRRRRRRHRGTPSLLVRHLQRVGCDRLPTKVGAFEEH